MKEGKLLKVLMLVVLVAGLSVFAVGCSSNSGGGGGGGDDTSSGAVPIIEIAPAGTCEKSGDALKKCQIEVDQAQLFPGETKDVIIRVRNSGERRLLIKKDGLSLDYSAPVDGEDPEGFVLKPGWCDDKWSADENCYVAPLGEGGDDPEELEVVVQFFRHDDEKSRDAMLRITTDASNSPVLDIELTTAVGQPAIQIPEEFINFELVGIGENEEKNINILNTGAADLEISGFQLNMTTGGEYYSLIVKGNIWNVGPDTANPGVTFAESVVVPPGEKTFFKVRFEPLDDDPATAKLRIFSNDPETPEGVEVKITGNESVPCIAVNPESVAFGGKKFGELATTAVEITSCGEAPLNITDIYVKEGSSPDFGIDMGALDFAPSIADPLVVPIGGTVEFLVTFIPDAPNPLDGNGNLILDEGSIIIENNSLNKLKEVGLSGAGVEIECPTAIIKCAEGDEVIPQTVLHMYGDESYASNGTIQKWEWEVDQPQGSQSVFVPSYTFPNPTFEANVAGVYKFYLTVYDQTNTPSCFPANYDVVVIPDEAIHIELLWHTPEDPDETDTGPEAGSDLDLHFLHPWAAGPDLDGDGAPDGWFDIPFDCFWFNAHPNWGSYDPAINDDPGLDRDDTDGAGPENINLDIPENVEYRVGVHYWNDHGYGASYATVRVYIYAQMVFELADIMLVDSDMWEVCTVEWPSGKVHVVTDDVGAYKITPKYQNPYFFQ